MKPTSNAVEAALRNAIDDALDALVELRRGELTGSFDLAEEAKSHLRAAIDGLTSLMTHGE